MASLPEAIIGSYKRYKTGTNHIISFLIQSYDTASCDTAKYTTSKRKSKAKQLRENKANIQDGKIKPRDLVEFAKTVVKKKQKVPPHLLSILEDVISARSKCARWYRRQPSHNTPIQHEQHDYFIRVLEDIHAILKSAEKYESNGAVPGKKPDLSSQKFENIFEYLENDEPLGCVDAAEADCDYFADSSSDKAVKTKLLSTSKESKIGEQLFALFCFFDDISSIRKFIGKIWSDYVQGKCGLSSAAVTTTTAINLIRLANEELDAQFPGMGNHIKLVQFFQDNGYAVLGVQSREFLKSSIEPKVASTISLSILLCVQTSHRIFASRLRDYKPSPARKATKDGGDGKSDSVYFEESDRDDALLLDYMCMNILFQDLEGLGYPMFQGFIKVRKTDILPSWLVIAFDIITKLRWTLWFDGTQQPYKELQTNLDSIKTQINQLIKYSRTWETSGFPQLALNTSRVSRVIGPALEIIRIWAAGDPVQRMKNRISRARIGSDSDLTTERHFLLKNDPVLCGLVLSQARLAIHDMGIGLASLDSIVGITAQVYNACLVSGRLESSWQDIEDLIDIHALDKTIFVGSRPDTPEGCSSRFFASVGVSVQTRAKGESFMGALRKHAHEGKKPSYKTMKPKRDMKVTSVYANIAMKQFRLYPSNLAEILPDIVGKQIKRYMNLKQGSNLTDFEDPALDEATIKRWQKHKKLGQIEMLEIFYKSIEADDFHNSFDYISMVERCVRILGAAGKASKDILARVLGDMSIAEEYSNWPHIWPTNFFEHWGDHQNEVGMIHLKFACEALHTVIHNEGDVEREKNLSVSCKADREANYIEIDALPTYQPGDTKSLSPFERILITTVQEVSMYASTILCGVDPRGCVSENFANQLIALFIKFIDNKSLLNSDSGSIRQESYQDGMGWPTLSKRDSLLFCFLLLLEKHKSQVKPETLDITRRAVLVLVTRPELPVEWLEEQIEWVSGEIPEFPEDLYSLENYMSEVTENQDLWPCEKELRVLDEYSLTDECSSTDEHSPSEDGSLTDNRNPDLTDE